MKEGCFEGWECLGFSDGRGKGIPEGGGGDAEGFLEGSCATVYDD